MAPHSPLLLALTVASIAACGSNQPSTSPGGGKHKAKSDELSTTQPMSTAAADLVTSSKACNLKLTSAIPVRPGLHHVTTEAAIKLITIQQGDACHVFRAYRGQANVTELLDRGDEERNALVIGYCMVPDEDADVDYDMDPTCTGAVVLRELDGTILDAQMVEFPRTLPMELEVVTWGTRRFLAYRRWIDILWNMSVASQHVHIFEVRDDRLHSVLDYPSSTAFWLDENERPVIATKNARDVECEQGFAVEIVLATTRATEAGGALIVDITRFPTLQDAENGDYFDLVRSTPGYHERYRYDDNRRLFSRTEQVTKRQPLERQVRCWSSDQRM